MHTYRCNVILVATLLLFISLYSNAADVVATDPRVETTPKTKIAAIKQRRFKKLVSEAERPVQLLHYDTQNGNPPLRMPEIYPLNTSAQHNRKADHVVFAFTVGFCNPMARFMPTLRQFFDGDVVIAMTDRCKGKFVDSLHEHKAIIYVLPISRVNTSKIHQAYFDGLPEDSAIYVPILRYYVYQRWAQLYRPSSLILLSDFRDVFFQSNPFDYSTNVWYKSPTSMAMSLELYPNKIIRNCIFNRYALSLYKCIIFRVKKQNYSPFIFIFYVQYITVQYIYFCFI